MSCCVGGLKGEGTRRLWRSTARVLVVDEGPPLAKVSSKPLDVPGSKINLGRHGCQILELIYGNFSLANLIQVVAYL